MPAPLASRSEHNTDPPHPTRRVYLAWRDDCNEGLVVKFFKKRAKREAYFDESMASLHARTRGVLT